MQEQLPVAVGIVVGDVPLRVLVDVGTDEPDLPFADVGVRLRERDSAVPEGLHLGSGQLKAGLVALEQLVVVPGPPVLGYGLDSVRRRHRGESRRGLWTNRHAFVAKDTGVCGSSGGQSTRGATSPLRPKAA